jgi:aminoglycoside phosphotransferase (APT) family kinase protein
MMQDDRRTLARDLTAYLARQRPGSSFEVSDMQPFGDGHSGFTYRLLLSGPEGTSPLVLRVAPPGVRNTGPADVGRQGRIMCALGATPVQVPRIVAFDTGPVLAGRSFALMELVAGVGWEQALAQRPPEDLARSAMAILRAMRAVTLDQTGLREDDLLTVPEEIDRWSRLFTRAPELAGPAAELEALLRRRIPEPVGRPSLVHGDFHFGNLIFDAVQGNAAAVVDWEAASLGDPRMDVASLAVAVLRRRYPEDPNPTGGLAIAPQFLFAQWEEGCEDLPWFLALACYKYAAILGYNFSLHVRGKRIDPIYERLQPTMRGLLADGAAILDLGLDSVTARTGDRS